MDERHVEENEIDLEKLDLNTVAVRRIPHLLVELFINKKKVPMEVDTDASCSMMSLSKFKEVGQLQELKERLRTYTGELVKPYRTTVVEVSHEGTKNRLPQLVMKGNVPTLLGRNWLKKVRLDRRTLFPLCEEGAPLKLKELLTEFESVFSEEMSCLKDFKAKIPMDKTMKPRFCRARSVPYKGRGGKRAESSGKPGNFLKSGVFSVGCPYCASSQE